MKKALKELLTDLSLFLWVLGGLLLAIGFGMILGVGPGLMVIGVFLMITACMIS